MKQKKKQIPSKDRVDELVIAGEKIRLGPDAVPSRPGKPFKEIMKAFKKAAEEGLFAGADAQLP